MGGLLDTHLAEKTILLTPFVNHIDYVADIYTDTASELGVEEDVA